MMNDKSSSMRLEKPHSLSYHESIFTILPPIIVVLGRSTIEEWGLPLKSFETSSSSEHSKMPVIDGLGQEFLDYVKTGMTVTVGEDGVVTVE